MSLKYMEGFDQFQGESGISARLASAGYVVGGTLTLSDGRTAQTRALNLGDGSASGSMQRTFESSQQIVCFGFAYFASAERSTILTIADVVTLGWDTETGKVAIGGDLGGATVALSVWYYFEVVIDKGLGEIRVYINDELDLTVNMPGGAAFINAFQCTWSSPGDIKKLDDIVFVDGSTGVYTNRLGPVQITPRMPSSDVDKEWSAAIGSEHFEMVNNLPVNLGEFIQSNTSGTYDTFLSNGPVPDDNDPNNVLAVGVVVRAKKSDVDGRQLGILIGDKVGPSKEQVFDLGTEDTYNYAVFEDNLADESWNDVTVTDTPFGVVVRP